MGSTLGASSPFKQDEQYSKEEYITVQRSTV